jgi:hypothetical protein
MSKEEKTIYYAGHLYYEMAGALLEKFKKALESPLDKLRENLENIKLESMYNSGVLDTMTEDVYNAKKAEVTSAATEDGLKLKLPKRMKKSPSKKRRSGSRRR